MKFKTTGSVDSGLPTDCLSVDVNLTSLMDDMHRGVLLSFGHRTIIVEDALVFFTVDHVYLTGYWTVGRTITKIKVSLHIAR